MGLVKINYWLKLFLASLGIILVYNQINAQTYAVGNTSVSANVGQLGNATASIPIYCPPGRLGIMPQISLTFNSQVNSGILGKGWNITGMSVISRSGSNWHLDNGVQETVKLNGNDKLTLDGQRLLLVQGSTTSFFTNGNIFRTEIDQFVKVVYKNTGGNEYFEVDTKDGGKVFYGYTADSKHKPVGSSNTLGWYITRSYDKNGNFMEYVYDNANGQILLTEIKYTGYDATFYGAKTSSIAQEAPFNKIELEYESTSHEGNQYINGEKIIQNKRLLNIKTYTEANLARSYLMEYQSDDLNSYLSKVTEQNGNGEQLKPVEITWTDDGGLERSSVFTNNSTNDDLRYLGDFNGDGKTDVLIIHGKLDPYNNELLSKLITYELITFTNNTSQPLDILAIGTLPYDKISEVMVGDVDNDGDDDIVFQTTEKLYNIVCQGGINCEYSQYKSIYRYKVFFSNSNKITNSVIFVKNIINNEDKDYYPSRTVNFTNGSLPEMGMMYQFSLVKPTLVEADGDGYIDLLEKESTGSRIYENGTFMGISPESYSNFIHILLSSKNKEINLEDRYYNYPVSLPKMNHCRPMDFNGNGKSDFLFNFDYNNHTEILEYDNSIGGFKHIYGTGNYQFPTKYDKHLKTGDFNGDGKTDLLYYLENKWMIAYSSGNDFIKYNATDLWFLHNFEPDWCSVPNAPEIGFHFDVADVNGDGKDDIIERHFHNAGFKNHSDDGQHIYYSKGFGFKKIYIGTNAMSGHNSGGFRRFYYNLKGDFDGDGKVEILLTYYNVFGNATGELLIENFDDYNSKLTKIAYSDLHSYNFTYQSLSADNGGVYTRTNTTYIGKSVSIKPAMYVVNIFNVKVNGLVDKTTRYEYADLLYNKHGRGLLGFTKTTAIDETTNGITNANKTITINEFKLNDAELFKLDLWRTRVHLVPNGVAASLTNMVSQTLLTSYSINTVPLNFDIRFFYNNSTVETNYVSGVKKTTCIEYDENGNLVFSQEVFDKIANATGVPEFTNTSRFEFNQFGSWLPSSLILSKNCKIRNGSTPHYTQTEMNYWANGNLKHTEYFKNNLSYYYKEMVNYDKYGNITNTSVDTANNATNITFKNKYFTYTNGRFLQKEKNALDQETQYVYEPVYGSKTSEQGPSGLTTTYQYDNWGKLIRTDYPDGNFENISFNWAASNSENIYYYTISSNSLNNVSWEYYNALNQKVMYKEKGFEGKIVTQKVTYNSDNLPETETNLYDATNSTTITDTKKTTEYTYDKYKRKETVKYNNVLMATYIYAYGTTKTTIKDGKNREKYTILNATCLVETSGDNGGTISYKYGSHNQVLETTTNGNTIFTDYNVQLNKISMTDPNTGTILYDYNAFGDLIGQKDANDFIYYYKYDGLGRLIQKWGGNDVYSYTYYNTLGNASINQLQKEEFKINGVSKHKKEYTYTALGKLSSLAETVNNQVYTTNYSYKTTNQQLVTVGYPTGITLTYDYDDFNNLKKITRNGNGVIWTKNTEAIDGKLTSESFGNGYTTTYSYDTHRQLSQINSTNVTNATTAFMANYNFELQTGNLLSRGYNNSAFEDFNYDNLDRLVNIQESISSNSKTYNYANNGNITSIENGGTHTLEYEDSRPHALTKHKFENVNQTVPASSIDLHDYVYTTFDKIAHIEQNGVATLDMEYGLDQQRISMHILEYGSPSVETYYINSANLEIKNGVEYTYLYAQGKPFAIYNGTTEELVYLHLNYQGSLMAISRDNGQILERRSYDAWGRPRDPDTWDYNLGMAFGGAGKGITMRGYTMHEHLEMFSLINMNGRLYDPVLGRMLSPDNYIQAPDNTQSYNRYSYCVNNPLKYTDPSGEVFLIPIIAAAVIFGGTNLAIQANNGNVNSFGDGLKAFGAGAIVGAALATGVGYGLTVPYLGTAIKAAGWVYGSTTVLSGISGIYRGATTGDWSRLENTGKIFLGNFYLDENRSFGEQVWQGISRFTWELPQSTIGHGLSQSRNMFGVIKRVDYFGGTTFATGVDPNSSTIWGVSLGNFINIKRRNNQFDPLNDPLLMHEYGHTFDSQLFGLSYLFAIGIPSASGAEWTEIRANKHASEYFKRFGIDWSRFELDYPTH